MTKSIHESFNLSSWTFHNSGFEKQNHQDDQSAHPSLHFPLNPFNLVNQNIVPPIIYYVHSNSKLLSEEKKRRDKNESMDNYSTKC